jgi:hypothetical protein
MRLLVGFAASMIISAAAAAQVMDRRWTKPQ